MDKWRYYWLSQPWLNDLLGYRAVFYWCVLWIFRLRSWTHIFFRRVVTYEPYSYLQQRKFTINSQTFQDGRVREIWIQRLFKTWVHHFRYYCISDACNITANKILYGFWSDSKNNVNKNNRIDEICAALGYNSNRVPKSAESIYKVQTAYKSTSVCSVNFNFDVYVPNSFQSKNELSASDEIKINQTKLRMWLKFKFSVQFRFYDQCIGLISFEHSEERL